MPGEYYIKVGGTTLHWRREKGLFQFEGTDLKHTVHYAIALDGIHIAKDGDESF
jgi:hypothetical protein